MTRLQMMTWLLLCLSPILRANELKRSCLSELLSSNETFRYFPSLKEQAASGNFDDRTLEFLSEAERFCECHAKAPDTNSIFPDTNARLAHEDACAGKTLGGDSFAAHYEIAQGRLSQEIIQRLQMRYPRAIRQLASVGSYNMKMSCLHEKIMSRCTQSKSLQMGYQCILQITTSRDFSRYEANCPEFRDENSPIPDHNDLLI